MNGTKPMKYFPIALIGTQKQVQNVEVRHTSFQSPRYSVRAHLPAIGWPALEIDFASDSRRPLTSKDGQNPPNATSAQVTHGCGDGKGLVAQPVAPDLFQKYQDSD